jgi:hypothetical protein
MAEKRKCVRFWWENPKEKDHSEDRGIDGRMGLEWTLGKVAGGGSIETSGRLFKHDDEPSGSGATELDKKLVSGNYNSYSTQYFIKSQTSYFASYIPL